MTVVDHTVLIKARPDATDEDISRFTEGIKSLKSIPGVLTITVGSTFVEEWMSDRRDGTTYALSVRLESKEALQTYQDHPLHKKVAIECVAPIVASPVIAVDVESELVLGEAAGGN